jgi:hypothetical protein
MGSSTTTDTIRPYAEFFVLVVKNRGILGFCRNWDTIGDQGRVPLDILYIRWMNQDGTLATKLEDTRAP